ncbi:MAG TPA: S8 family peptidase [Lapillicoccus sp.]|nr:S8 family peptidase [Lapillicoccus sp.]
MTDPPDPSVRVSGVSAGRGRSPIIGDLAAPVTASPPREPGRPEIAHRELSLEAAPVPPEQQSVVVVVELDSSFPGGLRAQQDTFDALWDAWWRAADEASATKEPITGSLYQCVMTRGGLARLVQLDQDRTTGPPVIRHAWPDYVLFAQVDRSAPTVKVDAARRAFNANGSGIVWAVIDTGIDRAHQHFSQLELAREGKVPADQLRRTGGLHRDFSRLVQPNIAFPDGPPDSPLTDEVGHGTHVAGIIAGACPEDKKPVVADSMEPVDGGFVRRTNVGPLAGMAQECELVSLKVFRQIQGAAVTSSSAVIAAIEYILREVNTNRQNLRIHGVNLSLGADWDPSHYAAGLSPLCQRIDELTASGVVVVISAGNNGQTISPQSSKQSVGVLASVTEPGHAASCITVGSTHREAPHVFGVSWTSSKGPTLDGRPKPDVVAPGEWICSAATGLVRASAGLTGRGMRTTLTYAEQSGTSAAAPHVSGVIAGFLSCRPEFIGRPAEVKALLMRTATDLGRDRYAQGAGLVDAMRMLADS